MDFHKLFRNILASAAGAIFTEYSGRGYWHKIETYEQPSDLMSGLKVGDIVYYYDGDEVEMCEARVDSVIDGIAYTVVVLTNGEPRAIPIRESEYCRSKLEAAKEWKKAIESDIEYYSGCYMNGKKMAALLEQIHDYAGD